MQGFVSEGSRRPVLGRTLPRERKGIGHGSSACRFAAVTTRDRGLDGRGLDRSTDLGRLTLPVARRRAGRPDLLGKRAIGGSGPGTWTALGAASNVFGSSQTPCGVAIDPAAGKIYWTNWFGGGLRVGNLDGTGDGPGGGP